MKRQEANRQILRILEKFIEMAPDQRFGQIICNYFIPDYREADPFFVESERTLQIAEANLQENEERSVSY